jgi:hypothetical protein
MYNHRVVGLQDGNQSRSWHVPFLDLSGSEFGPHLPENESAAQLERIYDQCAFAVCDMADAVSASFTAFCVVNSLKNSSYLPGVQGPGPGPFGGR